MSKMNIEAPVSVGDKVYYFSVFNQKAYVLSAPVAEVETVTNKMGTKCFIRLNHGNQFLFDDFGVRVFEDEETAITTVKKVIVEINEANKKIGKNQEMLEYGGVV